MSLVQDLIIKFEPAFSGLIGGAVRVFLGKEKSFWKAMVVMFTSASCAHFLTPLIAVLTKQWLNIDAQASLGFVVGYSAMLLLNRIEDIVSLTSVGKIFKQKP